MDSMILLSASVTTGLSVGLFALMILVFNALVPEEDRTYMDPLTFKLKLIWPFIRIIAHFFCRKLPEQYRNNVENRLQHTGVSYLLSAEQFIAFRIIMSILMILFTLVFMVVMDMWEPIFLIIAPLLGFMLPEIWLNDTRKKRESRVIRQMPVYLDFITMSVEAGLNLSGALAQAREKGPIGPLRNEFGIVLRDIRAGTSRADALRRMAARLDINEVTSFVSTIVQAERMGSSMGTVLRTQSEQRRTERFQRAEKQAMEAPVKLVGPLVMFIFPVTFIVIGFPIVMKFLSEGLF
jgi:tight adherence protein C